MTNLRANGSLIDSLGSMLSNGGSSLRIVPDLLRRVLLEDAWREFETKLGVVSRPMTFEEFVVTPPLRGLGASVALVRRIVADDLEVTDLLDQALRQPVGPRPVEDGRTIDNVNSSTISTMVTGNTQAQALRRLRDQQPALHTAVLAGELSPHAAMVQAGYRPRTVTVPINDDQRLAAALRRHLDPERRKTLSAALLAEGAP